MLKTIKDAASVVQQSKKKQESVMQITGSFFVLVLVLMVIFNVDVL